MNQRTPLHVYVIAGEPSGDALGGRLITALSAAEGDNLVVSGVGGEAMAEAGCQSLFPMHDLTVMGIAEVLPRLPLLLRRIRETADDIRTTKPDIIVTIDAPDFCFRVAKRIAGCGIPIVHYVAPSVWAWRPGRARKVARLVDHIMCLLPFEPPYFHREGLDATFVGHSILESNAGSGDGPGFRARHGIPAEAKLVSLLPGSRSSEVTRLLPVFTDAIKRINESFETLEIVIPTVPGVVDAVRDATQSWPNTCIVLGDEEKYDAFAASDAALAASGTVSLELAMARVPTLIAYKVSPLTAALAKRLLNVKYASITNLILEREAIPEFIQEKCTADHLVPAMAELLGGETAQRQSEDIDEALRALRAGDAIPSVAAAEVVRRVAGRGKKNAGLTAPR